MKNIPYRAPRTTTDLINIVEAEFPNAKTNCPHCNQPWKTGIYHSIMRFREHMEICQKRTKASKEKSDAIELETQRKRDTRAGRYSLLINAGFTNEQSFVILELITEMLRAEK